jgi:hypothetical protein
VVICTAELLHLAVLPLILKVPHHYPQESKGNPRVPLVPEKSAPLWPYTSIHKIRKSGERTTELCVVLETPTSVRHINSFVIMVCVEPTGLLSSHLFPYSYLSTQPNTYFPFISWTLNPTWLHSFYFPRPSATHSQILKFFYYVPGTCY